MGRWDVSKARIVNQNFIRVAGSLLGSTDLAGMAINGEIDVVEGTSVNAMGSIVMGGWGIEVTDLFTQMVDDDLARFFVLGHELGHFFSGQLVQKMGWNHLEAEGDEIIADLISIFVLTRMGHSWAGIITAVTEAQELVFNTHSNTEHAGKHPAAGIRIEHLRELELLVQGGSNLTDAASIILEGYKGA